MATLEELLAPIEGDLPTGEDLDDSDEFEALRTVFDIRYPIDVGLEEIEEGREAPPAVDWEEQIATIEELSTKTKDLFLAASLARCGVAADDIDAVERGLLMMAGLLETYWENAHPQIEGSGYLIRKGVCEQIAGRGAFAIPLLNLTVLGEGRMAFKAEQIMDAEAEGPSHDAYAPMKQILESWDDEKKTAVSERFQSLIDAIGRVEAAMTENAGDQEPPSFDTTIDYLSSIKKAYNTLAEIGSEDEADEGDSESSEQAQFSSSGPALSGEIRSRDDVLRALRAIETYYDRAEPGHPVKIAARRLAGWVNKDFMEILSDIVPGSVDGAKDVLLERPKDEY